MDLNLLHILFYVPVMLIIPLLVIGIIRSSEKGLDLCLINLVVTSILEIVRITAFIIPRWTNVYDQIPLGQAIAEHVFHVSWTYSFLLYFVEQTYCMKHMAERSRLSVKMAGVAVALTWMLSFALSLSAVLTTYYSSAESYVIRKPFSGRFNFRPNFLGVYVDDMSPIGFLNTMPRDIANIIETTGYVWIPWLALAATSIVAYRRWYFLLKKQSQCALSPAKSTRGPDEQVATPHGIEMIRQDQIEEENVRYCDTRVLPANSSLRFDWTLRKLSLNWFCPASFVLISLCNYGIWQGGFGGTFFSHFLGSTRFFCYLGTMCIALIHDNYLQSK